MKSKFKTGIYVFIACVLCVIFLGALTAYSRPMEDMSLDLSLMNRSEHAYTGGEFDDKGWTVYTQDGETVKELEATPSGAYLGIGLGETFYLSRVMSEALDSPTLKIGTAERTFSVWLDGELIYTDRPALDNRIGYLTLPMNSESRSEPITVSLPRDYVGKTLTIAQSTPTYSETPTVRAIPASVTLYCDYAYESEIVAESFSVALLSTAIFTVALLLLISFIRNKDLGMLCMAISAFLWMCMILQGTSFFTKYFGTSFINVGRYARLLSTVALGAFLALKAKKLGAILWSWVGLQGASVLLSLILYPKLENSIDRVENFFVFHLTEWIAVAGFITVLVFSALVWRKDSHFYRVFAPLAISVTVIGWATLLISNEMARRTLPVAFASGQVTLLYNNTFAMFMLSAVICAVYETVRVQRLRHAEQIELEHRRELIRTSYESICRQHEDVMKIKHDIAGHLEILKTFVSDEHALGYIEELIGQNKKIRSIVQTGNEMLDIILNSKLTEAQDAGISVDLFRIEAPEKLPLTDSDLCSLVMNVMNNAINAAKSSEIQHPSIHLDIHVKNGYFAFTCINSADLSDKNDENKKETVQRHGFGLKIINSILDQYDGLMEIKHDDNTYEVRIAIPLFEHNV